jgi:hypothetical protein
MFPIEFFEYVLITFFKVKYQLTLFLDPGKQVDKKTRFLAAIIAPLLP